MLDLLLAFKKNELINNSGILWAPLLLIYDIPAIITSVYIFR